MEFYQSNQQFLSCCALGEFIGGIFGYLSQQNKTDGKAKNPPRYDWVTYCESYHNWGESSLFRGTLS